MRYRALSLGSLCYWVWRVFFMIILVSCSCSLLLLLLLYIGQKSNNDNLVHKSLEDLIHREVYGEEPLFKVKNKVPRNRILIISYSKTSRLTVEVSQNRAVFFANINEKLEETEIDNLKLDSSRKPSGAAVVSALNLVRNVFDCERENSSKLLVGEERRRCRAAPWRAVGPSSPPPPPGPAHRGPCHGLGANPRSVWTPTQGRTV